MCSQVCARARVRTHTHARARHSEQSRCTFSSHHQLQRKTHKQQMPTEMAGRSYHTSSLDTPGPGTSHSLQVKHFLFGPKDLRACSLSREWGSSCRVESPGRNFESSRTRLPCLPNRRVSWGEGSHIPTPPPRLPRRKQLLRPALFFPM